MTTRHIVLAIRVITIAAIAVFALTTPGFTSQISINALLNAISFIGCVAVGMTFITLTGNIMSLCLGATLSASALIFLSSLSAGILPAFLLTLLFGIVVTAAQGMASSSARNGSSRSRATNRTSPLPRIRRSRRSSPTTFAMP